MDETEKELMFIQMALDDARAKGNEKHVVPAMIKLGLLTFTMATQTQTDSDSGKKKQKELFQGAEKHFQDAIFESKKQGSGLDEDQSCVVYERLSACAEKMGHFSEMEQYLSTLLRVAEKVDDEELQRRTRMGRCFAFLKLQRWKDLYGLVADLFETKRYRDKLLEKEAARLSRYLADCIGHLPPSDEIDKLLERLHKDPTLSKMETFLPSILRALCTSLNRRKKYPELSTAASEYAEQLRKQIETSKEKDKDKGIATMAKQCADMYRLSAIAYSHCKEHELARGQAKLGREVLEASESSENGFPLYLCCKEEIKALNSLQDFQSMLSVLDVAEKHLPEKEKKEGFSFYSNFGFTHQSLGNKAEALSKYEKAINIAKENGLYDSKCFNMVLICGTLSLDTGKTGWGINFLGRFIQSLKAEREDLACKALVLQGQLAVKGKKYQDAIDFLSDSWQLCLHPHKDRNEAHIANAGKNVKMAIITAAEMADIHRALDNLHKYCEWKELEIGLCEESDSPQDTVETKISFVNNLMLASSVEYKDKVQKHLREASKLVQEHQLHECGEKLSKLYVNLLASDDMVDSEFSSKILDAGLSNVSKFKVSLTEVKTHIIKGRLQDAEAGLVNLKMLVSQPHDEIELLLVEATVTTKKGELEAAGNKLSEAIEKAAQSSDGGRESLKLKASAMKQFGGNLNIRGRNKESLKQLQDSMAIFIELGDKEGELSALSSIGYVYLDLKEDSRAESAFKQYLDFAKSSGSQEHLCNALLDLGNLYINCKEIDQAEEQVTEALKIAQSLDIDYNIARAYAALCNIEFTKKNYKKSFEYANKAKELLGRTEDAVFAARLLANIGNIFEKLGNRGAGGSSMEFHKKNLQFAKESGDNVLYCISLLTLGETVNTNIATLLQKEQEDEAGNQVYVTKDVIEQAFKYFDECLLVAKRNQDVTSEGNALRGIASTKRMEISSKLYMRKVTRKQTGRRNLLKILSGRQASGTIQEEMNHASIQYLLWAAKSGDLERIKELILQHKIDPDISDEDQYTALHHASEEGHLPVVKFLIEDAKANAQCETVEFDTPYALALSRGRKDVSDYLKDIAGVLPFVKAHVMKEVEQRRISGVTGDYKQFSEYHRLAWNGQISQDLSDHDEFDIFKRTTLMMAAYKGHTEWVKAKLQEDPKSVSKKDTEDWNVLHWCCASEGGNIDVQIEIAELLIGTDASILKLRDRKGLTPHGVALQKGNKKLVNLLEVRYRARADNILLPIYRMFMFLLVMILYGFFFPLFVVVGFLRRRRITRILGKIPQTCFQILLPAQKIVFQKAHRAGLSEKLIFFLILPFLCFMWIYPTVLIMGIISSMHNQEIRDQMLYMVGIYYIMIALFLFFSTVKCFKEKELMNVRHPRKRIRLKIYPNDFRTSGTRAVINIVRILICIFDFLAFANFGIPKNLLDITGSQSSEEHHFLDGWKGFGSNIILDFRQNTFVYSFWLGVITVAIWFLLSTYLGSSMVILHNKRLGKMFPFVQPDFFSKIPGLSSIVPILAVAAVLPVSSIFFRALDCKYVSNQNVAELNSGLLFFQQRGVNMTALQLPPEIGPDFNLVSHCNDLGINATAQLPALWQSCPESTYTMPCETQYLNGLPDQIYKCCPVTECPEGFTSCLEGQRNIQCWIGSHIMYSMVGLTYLMYYIPSCVVIGIYFMEPDEDVNDIRFTGAYMMLEIALKWIMSLLYTFFDGLPVITQMGCITVTGVLAYTSYAIQPCKMIWSMNHYRSGAFTLNCWIAISALVGVIMQKQEAKPASMIGMEISVWLIMLVLGGGLIILVTLMIHASKLKVPLSKLYSTLRDMNKKEERRERRETELNNSFRKKTMVANPLNTQNTTVVQSLHAMTMDVELTDVTMKSKKVAQTSFIRTDNPLASVCESESPFESGEGAIEEGEEEPSESQVAKAQDESSSGVREKENPLSKEEEEEGGKKEEKENPLSNNNEGL